MHGKKFLALGGLKHSSLIDFENGYAMSFVTILSCLHPLGTIGKGFFVNFDTEGCKIIQFLIHNIKL